ncbi:MAG: VOC family protein [Acidimicrobiales bacterium]
MAGVTGIGGVFLRSSDPAALAAWYRQTLDVAFAPDGSYAIFEGADGQPPSVFALFGPDDAYIGAPGHQDAMVNLRVDDLDAVMETRPPAGARVEGPLSEANGRFAWAHDPEGRRVELWEPAATD